MMWASGSLDDEEEPWHLCQGFHPGICHRTPPSERVPSPQPGTSQILFCNWAGLTGVGQTGLC